ncbi:fimbrial protein FimD [Serratia inhibens]|uniref:Fimbrial protein FimD n=1 Tax=Serratia inhibens TaxID=2338073 RepID=A0AA92X343_9GAMM|nr:fimbria/pilus outer membrane usher protein [Serratia inhibens]RJF54055.1 fimbrial protein FimD [Serratia inhibens]
MWTLKKQGNHQFRIIKISPGSFFSVTAALTCLVFTQAHAELYFAPALISADPQMVADLSRFEKSGTQLPGNYQVDIYVNEEYITSRSLNFSIAENKVSKNVDDIRDDTGLIACLMPSDLESLGVNINKFLLPTTENNEKCISPGEYIPDAFTFFDFERMRLNISIPQAAMLSSARGSISSERWDSGINAAILNYSFSGNSSNGIYGNSRSNYINLNSGLNIGAWRIRDFRNFNEYDSKYYSYRKWQHTQSYAERIITPLRSELMVGDGSTNSDVFDSLGFRGVQIATDENMYPDSMRGFAPVVRGTARTNARVTIKQNGYTVYQTFVSPGAFIINDLYPVGSSGDLEVLVVEADGSTQAYTVPFSSLPVLQREGQLKYSLTAGRYQAGSDRYNHPKFMQGTLVLGLPNNITVYGGMQLAENYLSGLLGGGFNLGVLGALSADVTKASSTLADGSQHQGLSLRFLYARTLNSLGTTFQVSGYRYSTQGFHSLDETALKKMNGWRYDADTVDAEGMPIKLPNSDYYNLNNSRRAKLQASISQQIGNMGSVYFSGVRQTYWNTTGINNSLQAGVTGSVGRVNYSLSYSYNKTSEQPVADRSVFLSMSVPLDSLFSDKNRRTIYATYNASKDSDGTISHQTGFNGTALEANNMDWNISQGYTKKGGNNGALGLNYKGGNGNASLGYSYSSTYRQTNYGFAGGAILHSDGLTLGQPLGDTSVLVAAPGLAAVSVENEAGVSTDSRGYAIKPYASAYHENRVALDPTSLDDFTDIETSVSRVVPTRGAIVRASFKGHSGYRVIFSLNYKGSPLPFGTLVTAGERGGIVGDNGQVYLSGMQDEGIIRAEWGGGKSRQCSLNYRFTAQMKNQTVVKINGDCQ